MIFVTLGTQKQSFVRLLNEIEKCHILKDEEIVAQVGYTKYNGTKIKTFDFLEKEEFLKYIEKSEFVITHGGVGSIFDALLKDKKVLAIPRLKKYDEHVDDHQVEIVKKLSEEDYIVDYNPEEYLEEEEPIDLEYKINFLRSNIFQKYVTNEDYLIVIKRGIEELLL